MSEKRDCVDCKYRELSGGEEPCNTCITAENWYAGNRPEWKSRVLQWMCPGCAQPFPSEVEASACPSCVEKERDPPLESPAWVGVDLASTDTKPTNPKDRAATHRLDLSLFPDTAVIYGALAMTEGDCKYAAYNYRVAGVGVSTYVAAARRHMMKFYNGEWADPRTGVPHLGSALACIGVIVDGFERGNITDDRPPKVDVARLLTEYEGRVRHLHDLFPNGSLRYTEEAHGRHVEEDEEPAMLRKQAD